MSLQLLTKEFLSALSFTIDEKVMNMCYDSLSENQKKNSTFLSELLCNSQGIFLEKKKRCSCDLGIFGVHCQKYGVDVWKGWLTFFQIIFGICYGILSIVFVVALIFKIFADFNVLNKCKRLKRLLVTPKYIVIFNLIIVAVSRFFFIVIDPFSQKKISSHQGNLITFYLIFPPFLAFYLELFIVWSGINSVFVDEKNKKTKACYKCIYSRLKLIFLVVIILSYPIEVIICLVKSLRRETSDIDALILFGIIVVIIMLIGFDIYLIFNLKRKIYKQLVTNDRDNFDVKIIQEKSEQDEEFNTSKDEINNKKDVIDFLREMTKINGINLIESYIFNKEKKKAGEESDILESKLDFEKEIINFDIYSKADISQENNNEHQNKQNLLTEETTLKKNEKIERKPSFQKKKTSSISFTQTDKKVILKIFGMSTSFIITTICMIAIDLTLTGDFRQDGESSVLVLIVFSLGLEIAGIAVIYTLFFKSLNVQEYQNLKIIGQIDKYINPTGDPEKQPKIFYQDFTTKQVFNRFKHFVIKY